MENEYNYNGTFNGNILVVGRTGCGKATFIQQLGSNKIFGTEIKDVFWVSKTFLSKGREDVIRESFQDQEVNFSYPQDLDGFEYLLGNFTQNKSEYTKNELGEELKIDKLIIMDNVSGLADKSGEFSNFFTVSRKYGFSCLYVFHTIYSARQSWEMIMSQTHIFNFFPGSIHSSRILKTLSLFASRQKNTYLPNQQVWLNKLYFQILNSKEKKCLPIDTREVNELGPGKFRTSADSGEEQICYFNRNKSDTHFTFFQSNRIRSSDLSIRFSIVKTNSDYFELTNKSLDINVDNSILKKTDKEQFEKSDRENFNNGRSEISFSSRRAEPRNALEQQRGGHKRSREQSRNKKTPKISLSKEQLRTIKKF